LRLLISFLVFFFLVTFRTTPLRQQQQQQRHFDEKIKLSSTAQCRRWAQLIIKFAAAFLNLVIWSAVTCEALQVLSWIKTPTVIN